MERFCAVCLAEQWRKYGRFVGDENLERPVARVNGIALCGKHNAEALDVDSEVARAVDEAAERVRGMLG